MPKIKSSYAKLLDTFLCLFFIWYGDSVPPMLSIPNQLEAAYQGQDVTLECQTEAYPASINYWTTEKGDMIISGKFFAFNIGIFNERWLSKKIHFFFVWFYWHAKFYSSLLNQNPNSVEFNCHLSSKVRPLTLIYWNSNRSMKFRPYTTCINYWITGNKSFCNILDMPKLQTCSRFHKSNLKRKKADIIVSRHENTRWNLKWNCHIEIDINRVYSIRKCVNVYCQSI